MSCCARWWWDGFQYSNACCLMRVGASGHVLSCLVLKCIIIRGPQLSDHLPGTWVPPAWFLRGRAHAMPGHEDEADWDDRWWIPARPRLLWWGKNWCGLLLGLVLFMLVGPPLQLGVVRLYPVWSIWFPSRLPLEETRLYPDFLDRNRWSAVPGVQDPNRCLNAIFLTYSIYTSSCDTSPF
jgi:hypothetical protein